MRDEILFCNLKDKDTLIIHTENSAYIFSITDLADHRGRLKGGEFGARPVLACLADFGIKGLRVGSRALFLVEVTGGLRRLLTSSIRKLYISKPLSGAQAG